MNADRAPAVQTRGLRRSYGKFVAVEALDLTAYPGEIYGFLGVNGAGKTTTLQMLMGILPPDAGEITILGRTVKRVTRAEKLRMSFVSQEQNFYPWMRCGEIGTFVGRFYPQWSSEIYRTLLGDFRIPVERKTADLSGGMRAKLALALALAAQPEVLILDEPTAGLDPLARREFMALMLREVERFGRTVLFSSHLIDEVERCADRIGIIDQGRCLLEESTQKLRDSVRLVSAPANFEGPAHGTILARCPGAAEQGRNEWIERGDDSWEDLPAGIESRPASLEEIFISLVSR